VHYTPLAPGTKPLLPGKGMPHSILSRRPVPDSEVRENLAWGWGRAAPSMNRNYSYADGS
jgi:hypothetical protein